MKRVVAIIISSILLAGMLFIYTLPAETTRDQTSKAEDISLPSLKFAIRGPSELAAPYYEISDGKYLTLKIFNALRYDHKTGEFFPEEVIVQKKIKLSLEQRELLLDYIIKLLQAGPLEEFPHICDANWMLFYLNHKTYQSLAVWDDHPDQLRSQGYDKCSIYLMQELIKILPPPMHGYFSWGYHWKLSDSSFFGIEYQDEIQNHWCLLARAIKDAGRGNIDRYVNNELKKRQVSADK